MIWLVLIAFMVLVGWALHMQGKRESEQEVIDRLNQTEYLRNYSRITD